MRSVPDWVFSCDPQARWFDRPSEEPGPAETLFLHADFEDLRDQLLNRSQADPKVTTAYTTLLGFIEHPPAGCDVNRWRYARRVLRAAALSCRVVDVA